MMLRNKEERKNVATWQVFVGNRPRLCQQAKHFAKTLAVSGCREGGGGVRLDTSFFLDSGRSSTAWKEGGRRTGRQVKHWFLRLVLYKCSESILLCFCTFDKCRRGKRMLNSSIECALSLNPEGGLFPSVLLALTLKFCYSLSCQLFSWFIVCFFVEISKMMPSKKILWHGFKEKP